jgi:hypothetical protein
MADATGQERQGFKEPKESKEPEDTRPLHRLESSSGACRSNLHGSLANGSSRHRANSNPALPGARAIQRGSKP